MATEYDRVDSNWVPTLEERAKFVDGRPLEITHSIFRSDTMLLMPLRKWKCTYEDGKMVICELQSYQDK